MSNTQMMNAGVGAQMPAGLRQLPNKPVPVPGQRLEGRRNRYRVLAGIHLEPIIGEETDLVAGTGFAVYRAGDVFETENDYDKWGTKMRNINQEGVAANAHLFDPTKETLEQFIVRMRGVYGNAPPQAQPDYCQQPAAPVANASAFDDTYAAMTEEDLRKFANELGIPTKKLKGKDEFIQAIKNAENASRG